jgi:hypothetical protein
MNFAERSRWMRVMERGTRPPELSINHVFMRPTSDITRIVLLYPKVVSCSQKGDRRSDRHDVEAARPDRRSR